MAREIFYPVFRAGASRSLILRTVLTIAWPR
jgi:hypothetical protein